jgi:predicted transcriptional regulator
MVRRSRFDYYCDVLKAIELGVEKPTRIMYKANLTYTMLQDIFTTLVHNRFIREEISGAKKRYYITRKGKNALHHDRQNLQNIIAIQ